MTSSRIVKANRIVPAQRYFLAEIGETDQKIRRQPDPIVIYGAYTPTTHI